MQTILHNCCGLDIHKDSVVACILKTSNFSGEASEKEVVEKEIREFETFTNSLLELKTWLESHDCHHVAMESTGVYWLPVYEMLETAYNGEIQLLVANARHMRNVPGKKTDIKDSEWIAKLLRAGLLNGSFIPPKDIRELRDLTRYRKNIVEDICTQKNRIEKFMQTAGIKLSSFLSDIFGVSGRNLIRILMMQGYLTPKDVEIEAKYISQEKRNDIKRTISIQLTLHQRDFLRMQMAFLNDLDRHLESIELSITELSNKFNDAIDKLKTIPGIAETAATAIIAEIGTDMSKFPTAEHFCSWAGLAPGSNESAGKKKVHTLPRATHT
jgi:transposase